MLEKSGVRSSICRPVFRARRPIIRSPKRWRDGRGRSEAQRRAVAGVPRFGRESLEQQLYSPAPIYDDLELVKLADALALMTEQRGGDDPLVQQVLAGKSPRERAADLIRGTTLGDVEQRKAVARSGLDGLKSSRDR